jgi:general secretion pathway protein B
MSYILEALKKAQAERQLGNAPDIHTPAPVPVAAASSAVNRKPLLIGLGAGVLVAGIAAGLVWRAKTPAPEPAVLARKEAAPAAPAPAPAPTAVIAPSAPPKEPAAAATVAPAPVPAAPPARRRSEPLADATPAGPAPAETKPRRAPAQAPTAARDPAPEAVYLPAPTPPAPVPVPARAPDPIPEENLRTLQQLPEAIQREVPKVAVGGYIYSPNPADRLLLVDKMLRREGEELAPGLVLERLMPKYAVMNYRGTRYRVAY